MTVKKISLALTLKLFLVVLTAYLATKLVPFLGFFPYKGVLDSYPLPEFLRALANFDGVHYLLIAKNGYSQYEQAFFPIYPLLIRFLAFFLGGNELLSGLLISNLSFVLGVWIFIKTFAQKKTAKWLLLFLLTFPTAFFFHTVYTESLFFLLVSLTFYFCQQQSLKKAALFAYLASLTRLMGLFLVIPLILSVLKHKQKRLVLYASAPILGLLTYMTYLGQTTGDPLFFFTSQPIYGEARSTNLILLPQVYFRYFKILFTADFSFAYFVSILEMGFFSVVLLTLLLDLKKQLKQVRPQLLALNLFSLVNILLPTFTGSFLSVPRFVILSLSFFVYLSNLKLKSVKIGLLVIFTLGQIVLLSLFVQGYFIS